jgi:hypothetical protein
VAVVMICMFRQYTWLVRGYFDGGKVGQPWVVVENIPMMTKGTAAVSLKVDAADDEQQVPPLRYASVGMTLLFGCLGLLGGIGEGRRAHCRSLHCATLRSG